MVTWAPCKVNWTSASVSREMVGPDQGVRRGRGRPPHCQLLSEPLTQDTRSSRAHCKQQDETRRRHGRPASARISLDSLETCVAPAAAAEENGPALASAEPSTPAGAQGGDAPIDIVPSCSRLAHQLARGIVEKRAPCLR